MMLVDRAFQSAMPFFYLFTLSAHIPCYQWVEAQMLRVARAIGNIRQTLEEYLALDNEGSEGSPNNIPTSP